MVRFAMEFPKGSVEEFAKAQVVWEVTIEQVKKREGPLSEPKRFCVLLTEDGNLEIRQW